MRENLRHIINLNWIDAVSPQSSERVTKYNIALAILECVILNI